MYFAAIARVDVVLDEGIVAAHIKLEQAHRVGGGFSGFLQPRLRHRAQHMGGAEPADAAHHGSGTGGIEDFQRADRRQHHRQPHLAAEALD